MNDDAAIHAAAERAGVPLVSVRRNGSQVELVLADDATPEQRAAASSLLAAERARPRTDAERLRDLGLDPVRAALVLVEVGTTEEAAIAEVILADELARVRRALGGRGVTNGMERGE